jgi:hypothetical protein
MAANPLSNVSIVPGLELSQKKYTELCRETKITVQRIVIANSTDSAIVLAVGEEKKEIDYAVFGPGATLILGVGMNAMPKGSRLSVKPLDPNTKGHFSVSLL